MWWFAAPSSQWQLFPQEVDLSSICEKTRTVPFTPVACQSVRMSFESKHEFDQNLPSAGTEPTHICCNKLLALLHCLRHGLALCVWQHKCKHTSCQGCCSKDHKRQLRAHTGLKLKYGSLIWFASEKVSACSSMEAWEKGSNFSCTTLKKQ